MRILGLMVFTRKGFGDELREAKKDGHKFALAEFCGANEVHYATPIVARSDMRGKIVILGDGLIIANNKFITEDNEASLEIC